MTFEQDSNQVVFTYRARCRDCYRCIRVCPVHAIGMRDGQAFVDSTRCISCGTCIRECPQQAKSFRRDLSKLTERLAKGGKIAASIAPSFACVFSDWQRRRLPSVLRKLGFSHVAETAVGAYYTAQKTAEVVKAKPEQLHITTACPAVVGYIQKYRPNLVEFLTPVLSPMRAHAAMIRQQLGEDTTVVFIGPCVAKKHEADGEQSGVDLALTFDELDEWLNQEEVDLAEFEESDFDQAPAGLARSFPLEGGGLATAKLPTDFFEDTIVTVSGIDEIIDILNDEEITKKPLLLEPLFCRQGCINGPAMHCESSVFERKKSVLEYTQTDDEPDTEKPANQCQLTLTADYQIETQPDEAISENQIREVLAQTGKENPEDQLNCGACGYASCRDQAIAVLRGMAEIDMCIPFMRRLAEQRTDRIIETSPNGIVILDEHLRIIHVNPSFKKLFMCSEGICGKGISYLMEADPFEQVSCGEEDMLELTVQHEKYGLICHEIIYALREENQYVGVFVNLTKALTNKKKYDQLRQQTVQQAKDLLRHQVEIAGKIAEFLGTSTAESEKLLSNLTKITHDGPASAKQDGLEWLKDIYISK